MSITNEYRSLACFIQLQTLLYGARQLIINRYTLPINSKETNCPHKTAAGGDICPQSR